MIKEIEEKYDMWADDFNLDPQDVECLIKQAKLGIVQQEQFHDYQTQNLRLQKRVQELEKDVKEWETVNELWKEVNENLAVQNKRYREAIEGIENAWKLTNDYQEYMNAIHDIIKDLEESK